MKEISEEAKVRFFEEAGICLKRGGFQTGPVEDGFMPVFWQEAPLCRVNGVGGVRYRSEVTRDPGSEAALNRAMDIVDVTEECMRLLEKAPRLNATGLDESYKLLNEFNSAVLAAHHTPRHGWDFVTWCRDYSGKAVTQEEPIFCITGNIIDRKPENGGNGIGCQEDIAYTLTATDHHAVFSRQRVDVFTEDDVASTESARQHKDATDLVYQGTVGALTSSDRKGANSQYVAQDKCIIEGIHLIRRLTPLECERLQGFPDGWTAIPGASDSARYKALGNSVAIPCVKYVMRGIAIAMRTA